MSSDERQTKTVRVDTLLAAFRGPVESTPIGPLYRAALVLVGTAMVLLPIAYVGLIALTVFGVWWHVVNDAWILSAKGSAIPEALAYGAPVIAAVILIVFMVKPFFAPSGEAVERVSLDDARHRPLFALIERICGAIGAPMPVRVQVNCSVNASASFVGGPFRVGRREFTLTIGLPLAAGLTTAQLAGVLAHELGHFAQGAGMRLTYAIRWINQWFWRVVNERDQWDEWLEKSSRGWDPRIGVVLWLARAAIQCTREVLGALMVTAQAISCLMLRQMEYDADSYEVKVSGSDAFAGTMSRLRELDAAVPMAYGDVQRGYLAKRVPDDFVALVVTNGSGTPAERANTAAPTPTRHRRLFDTHPSDEQRVAAAAAMHVPGVFARAAPASELFDDFEQLCRTVTRDHYERHLRLDLSDVRLTDTREAIEESRHVATAMQALNRMFAGVVNMMQPIAIDVDDIDCAVDSGVAAAQLEASRRAIDGAGSESADARSRLRDLEDERTRAMAARQLMEAGYAINPGMFGLSEATTAAADAALARLAADQDAVANELARHDRHIARQLSAACHMPGPSRDRALSLARLLAALNEPYESVVAMNEHLIVFDHVVAYATGRGSFDQLTRYATDLMAVLGKLVTRIRTAVAHLPYQVGLPGDETVTMLDYLRRRDVTTEDFEAVMLDAKTHVARFFDLYWPTVAELAAIVEEIPRVSTEIATL